MFAQICKPEIDYTISWAPCGYRQRQGQDYWLKVILLYRAIFKLCLQFYDYYGYFSDLWFFRN